MRIPIVTLIFCASLAAQNSRIEDVMGPVVRAGTAGAEVGRLNAESAKLNAEAAQIRAQTERMRRPVSLSELAVDRVAWARLEANMIDRFPDFNTYRAEMVRLMDLFSPRNVRLAEYVEGLYLMAKYASFAKAPEPNP
jgi:hypothetical protein